MQAIVFGGAGFLGKKLALEILKQGSLSLNGSAPKAISKLIVFDHVAPTGFPEDDRLELVQGDICDKATIKGLLEQKPDVIFHLAAIVSGEAEKNFDLGMNVNMHATHSMLELCRELDIQPCLVFASTCGVFGGDVNDTIRDDTAPVPRNSYGMQKAISELLVNDYSRRGFVDGRALRLPTIAVRGGKANAATTSFVSSIIREPLNGQRANCPVDASTPVWILSPTRVTQHFIHAASIPNAKLSDSRIITLPGLTTTIGDMVTELEGAAGKETTALIDWEPDAFIQSIVLTFPANYEISRAGKLGFEPDASAGEVIRNYMGELAN